MRTKKNRDEIDFLALRIVKKNPRVGSKPTTQERHQRARKSSKRKFRHCSSTVKVGTEEGEPIVSLMALTVFYLSNMILWNVQRVA